MKHPKHKVLKYTWLFLSWPDLEPSHIHVIFMCVVEMTFRIQLLQRYGLYFWLPGFYFVYWCLLRYMYVKHLQNIHDTCIIYICIIFGLGLTAPRDQGSCRDGQWSLRPTMHCWRGFRWWHRNCRMRSHILIRSWWGYRLWMPKYQVKRQSSFQDVLRIMGPHLSQTGQINTGKVPEVAHQLGGSCYLPRYDQEDGDWVILWHVLVGT